VAALALLPFQARRQIAAALGKTRRQILRIPHERPGAAIAPRHPMFLAVIAITVAVSISIFGIQ